MIKAINLWLQCSSVICVREGGEGDRIETEREREKERERRLTRLFGDAVERGYPARDCGHVFAPTPRSPRAHARFQHFQAGTATPESAASNFRVPSLEFTPGKQRQELTGSLHFAGRGWS